MEQPFSTCDEYLDNVKNRSFLMAVLDKLFFLSRFMINLHVPVQLHIALMYIVCIIVYLFYLG